MRPIKFRVYSRKYRVMEHCETIKELYDVTHNNKDVYIEERENIIMQFTGLLDKNGKEIFEGDIIKTTLYEGSENEYEVFFQIIHNGWKFKLKSLDYILSKSRQDGWKIFGDKEYTVDDDFLYSGNNHNSCGKSEIIGNIYENPDFLK